MAKDLCHKCYYVEYRKHNKQAAYENAARWKRENPEKVKAANAVRRKRYKGYSSSVTRNEVLTLYETQKYCAGCHQYFNETKIATLDHKNPIVRGGEHEIENLHLLCQSCNSSKGSKTWDEYLEWLKSAQHLT